MTKKAKKTEIQKIAEDIMGYKDPFSDRKKAMKKIKQWFEKGNQDVELCKYTNDQRLLNFEQYEIARFYAKINYKKVISASREHSWSEFHKCCLQAGIPTEYILLMDILVGNTKESSYDHLIKIRNQDRSEGGKNSAAGYHPKEKKAVEEWETGNYETFEKCAEEICDNLCVAHSTVLRYLRNNKKLKLKQAVEEWQTGKYETPEDCANAISSNLHMKNYSVLKHLRRHKE